MKVTQKIALVLGAVILSSSPSWSQDNQGFGDDIMTEIFAEADTPSQTAPDASQPVAPMPDQAELQPPAAVPPQPAIQNTPIEADLYFDAEALIPKGELATKGSASRMNPVTQPASRFVVVEKDYGPNSSQSKMVAAQRATALGRYEAALEIYTQLRDKSPKQPQVLLGYATALQKLGRDEEAIKAYEDLLDVQPDNMEAHINMLGIISRTYPAVALQRLSALQAKHPDNPSLLGQMAYVQANAGHYEAALSAYAQVAALQPENASHLFNMAVVADRAGMKQQAIEYYQKALDTDTIYGGGRSVPREQIFDRLANLR